MKVLLFAICIYYYYFTLVFASQWGTVYVEEYVFVCLFVCLFTCSLIFFQIMTCPNKCIYLLLLLLLFLLLLVHMCGIFHYLHFLFIISILHHSLYKSGIQYMRTFHYLFTCLFICFTS